jgi:hypothetical protein
MPFVVECHQCRKKIKIKDEYRGRKFNCPECQTALIANDPSAPLPTPEAAVQKMQPKPQASPETFLPPAPSTAPVVKGSPPQKPNVVPSHPVSSSTPAEESPSPAAAVAPAATTEVLAPARGYSLLIMFATGCGIVGMLGFAAFLLFQLESDLSRVAPFLAMLFGSLMSSVINLNTLHNNTRETTKLTAPMAGSIVSCLATGFVAMLLMWNAFLFAMVLGGWMFAVMATALVLVVSHPQAPQQRRLMAVFGTVPVILAGLVTWGGLGMLYLGKLGAEQQQVQEQAEKQRQANLPENQLKAALNSNEVPVIEQIFAQHPESVQKLDPTAIVGAIKLGRVEAVKLLADAGALKSIAKDILFIDIDSSIPDNKAKGIIYPLLLTAGVSFPSGGDGQMMLARLITRKDLASIEALIKVRPGVFSEFKDLEVSLLKIAMQQNCLQPEDTTKTLKFLLENGCRFKPDIYGWNAIYEGYNYRRDPTEIIMNEDPEARKNLPPWSREVAFNNLKLLREHGIVLYGTDTPKNDFARAQVRVSGHLTVDNLAKKIKDQELLEWLESK